MAIPQAVHCQCRLKVLLFPHHFNLFKLLHLLISIYRLCFVCNWVPGEKGRSNIVGSNCLVHASTCAQGHGRTATGLVARCKCTISIDFAVCPISIGGPCRMTWRLSSVTDSEWTHFRTVLFMFFAISWSVASMRKTEMLIGKLQRAT